MARAQRGSWWSTTTHDALALLVGILADAGHDVRAAGSPREARALLA